MSAQAIVAPTDAQLDYLRSLCEERGLPMPALLIGEILRREYHPPESQAFMALMVQEVRRLSDG